MASNNKSMKYFVIGFVVLVVALAAIFLVNVFRSKETYTSIPTKEEQVSAVVCTAGDLEGGFFRKNNAGDFRQEIKVTFNGEKIDKLNYNLIAKYSDDEAAKKASSDFHANYNIYMGKEAENLTPTFNHSGVNIKINLFADEKNLSKLAGRVFFLDGDEYVNFFRLTKDRVTKIYKAIGFVCKGVE